MKTINLKDFYASIYSHDCFCDVPDEVAELLMLYKRREQAYRRRVYRHKAFYSLNRNDGIENTSLSFAPSAEEVYEKRVQQAVLCDALEKLTDKQLARVYAHIILNMGYTQIAHYEGVGESSIRRSVERALYQLQKNLNL